MRTILREFVKKLILFFLLLGFLWFMLVMSIALPNEKIAENFEKSALYYKNSEAFSFENGKKLNAVSDNYADTIVLNLSYNMGRKKPLSSSLETGYYSGEEAGLNVGLYRTVTEDILPDTEYTRYWHGTAMIIRWMHLFTDISGIKIVGFVKVIFLLATTIFILVWRKNYITALALFISSACIHIWNVALSLEYQSSFIIGFLMCILFLLTEKKHEEKLSYLALSGGCLVAFFDFLTTETVSILLPLILVTSVRNEENRLCDKKSYVKSVINCGITYGGAYALTFISKWVLAGIATGKNVALTALEKSEMLISGKIGDITSDNLFLRMIKAVFANFTALTGGEKRVDYLRVFLYILIVLAIVCSLLYLFGRKEKVNGLYILFALGALAVLRYIILPGHSYMHCFFTYRALISTLTAIIASVGVKMKTRRVNVRE